MARRSDAEIKDDLQAQLAQVTERQARKADETIGEMRLLAKKLRARARDWSIDGGGDLADELVATATALDSAASQRVALFAERHTNG